MTPEMERRAAGMKRRRGPRYITDESYSAYWMRRRAQEAGVRYRRKPIAPARQPERP